MFGCQGNRARVLIWSRVAAPIVAPSANGKRRTAPRASRRSLAVVDAYPQSTARHVNPRYLPVQSRQRLGSELQPRQLGRPPQVLRLSGEAGPHMSYRSEITVGALFEAYYDCRRQKRNTSAARAFEFDLENNLMDLLEDLRAGTWSPEPSRVFMVKHPKPREVWAASFRDRIVHHLLYNAVRDLFEPSFLADCCASIKGRGTLYAADRFGRHLRSETENWTKPAFVLKADIASFFSSIRHVDLIALLRRRIRDDLWLDIAEKLVRQDVKIGADIRCSWGDLALIPPRKSLFHAAPGVGLPIGNLSSQFFANVLLDPLDQMVRRKLGIRHYCRYVDDFALVHRDPKVLLVAADAIRAHLSGIGLVLAESKTAILPVEKGIDFVGHVIRPHRHSARAKTVRHAVRRILEAPIDEAPVTVTSYLGLLKHTGSRQQIIEVARAGRRRGLKLDRELTKATGRLRRVPVRSEP